MIISFGIPQPRVPILGLRTAHGTRYATRDRQMDILQATLAAGIRVVKYVPSYGDQPNDIQHVTKCASSRAPAPRDATRR